MNKWVWQFLSLDLSQKYAIPILVIFLTYYASTTINEVITPVDYADYEQVQTRLTTWQPNQISPFEPHARYALLKASEILFNNVKVIPFLESIGVLVVVYFLTVKLSGKRISGIFAVSLISSSHLFKYFDTSAAFDNSWILFYILSLYVIFNKWQLSPVFFILSMSCKPLTFLFIPATFYFIYKSTLDKNKKAYLLVTYFWLTVFILIIISLNPTTQVYTLEFDLNDLVYGLTEWWFFMFSDLYMVSLLPVIMICLYILHKKGYQNTLPVLACMLMVIISGGMVEGFTNMHNEPYRYIPLVVFFAIAVGLFFQKPPTKILK